MTQDMGVAAIIQGESWTTDLSKRVVAVLYGYLDDSGTHEESPVAIMAGYVASVDQWRQFEHQSGLLFKEEKIDIFRAKKFAHGQGDFKGWTSSRKIKFAKEWFDLARGADLIGVTAGVVKADYMAVKKTQGRIPALSAIGYCLQVGVRKMAEDADVWSRVRAHGLSLFVESSSANVDGGILKSFDMIREANDAHEVLRSISFVDKSISPALQIADYLAYYSWQFAITARNDDTSGFSEFLGIALKNCTPNDIR